MGAAIGMSRRGNAFTRFTASKSIAPYLGAELREKIEKPLKFQWGFGGAQDPPSEVNGYDVTLLIDICKAILSADSAGDLSANQAGLAKQARIILNASAKAGIKGLAYAVAGYDATREEVITAFKMFVREEAREYEKEFPDLLYEEWYRLYQLPKPAWQLGGFVKYILPHKREWRMKRVFDLLSEKLDWIIDGDGYPWLMLGFVAVALLTMCSRA